jgi:phosphoglycerate dehydrogenase-like enzyme
MVRIAVLDDWQGVARQSADWARLLDKAEVVFFETAFRDADEAVTALREFDVLLAMRERTALTRNLIERLPRLRMIALTGARSGTLDLAACTARGILVCHTGGEKASAATAELALGLLLAAARRLTQADASMRDGRFQQGLAAGSALEGRTLGVIGLGKIGTRVARYGLALGMRVLAWSENLTAERAQAAGVERRNKIDLMAQADAVSLHLVLSERTRGVIGAAELACMKPGAILVNTSRGPLVDEAALIHRVEQGLLIAALDVYNREPLPDDHALRRLPGTVLTPHQGYCTREVYEQFYRESIENVQAWLAGRPLRALNPQVLSPDNP